MVPPAAIAHEFNAACFNAHLVRVATMGTWVYACEQLVAASDHCGTQRKASTSTALLYHAVAGCMMPMHCLRVLYDT